MLPIPSRGNKRRSGTTDSQSTLRSFQTWGCYEARRCWPGGDWVKAMWSRSNVPFIRHSPDGRMFLVEIYLRRLVLARWVRRRALWRSARAGQCRAERPKRGRFVWPSMADGIVTISVAQMSYLLSGSRLASVAATRSRGSASCGPERVTSCNSSN